ncbi:MAG: hypothetical protein NTV92_04905, partial [Candidatus Bipolaricaulota bacterium]|nr:hypothetical protein [Candidatus Bipolaricaulota bacterium]
GKEIKAKSLRRLHSGCVIYNRLFAAKGSFAILGAEHEGCVASSEFPTFVVKDGVEHPGLVKEYIVHCMNSLDYLRVIGDRSTGSTKQSRNRFNQKLFLRLTILLPKTEDGLTAACSVLKKASQFRARQEYMLELAKEYREGLLALLPVPWSGAPSSVCPGQES